MGVDGGISELDPANAAVIRTFTHHVNNLQGLSNNYIKAMAADSNGMIWIGHDLGVSILDPDAERFFNYDASFEDHGIVNNYVKCLLSDASNIMWIGTDLGISFFDPSREPFLSFTHQPGRDDRIGGKLVYGFFEDAADSIWLATNNGLDLWNPLTNKVQHFRHNPDVRESLSSNIVRSVTRDAYGTLWVGTDNGLNQLVVKRGLATFRHVGTDGGNGRGLNNMFVVTIKQVDSDHLWIGTWGGGVNILNLKTGAFTYLTNDSGPDSLRLDNNQIANIFKDSQNRIWLRSGNIYNLNTHALTTFPFGHAVDNINFFFEDREGRIWIGTSSNGLCYYDPDKDSLQFLKQFKLLSEGVVVGMLQDNDGNYWIAVNKSLVKLTASRDKMHEFDASDGLHNGDFSNEAALKASDGTMYFGGSKGITYFRPEDIRLNERPIQVYLTGIHLFNRKLKPEPGGHLDSALITKKKLILPYNHRELVFEFTGINYTNPLKNKYAFKIDGLQSDWVYTDAENRKANYFQLPPENMCCG